MFFVWGIFRFCCVWDVDSILVFWLGVILNMKLLVKIKKRKMGKIWYWIEYGTDICGVVGVGGGLKIYDLMLGSF